MEMCKKRAKSARERRKGGNIIELVIYRGDGPECEWLDRYVRENCKGPPEGPRVTLCRDRERVVEALRILSACDGAEMQDTLFFRSQERAYLLRIEDVRCFIGENHKVYATLKDGTRLESLTLRVTTAEFLEPLLKSGTLLHISRTVYVNPACVRTIEAKHLYLDDGKALNISRRCYQSTVAALERLALLPKRTVQ